MKGTFVKGSVISMLFILLTSIFFQFTTPLGIVNQPRNFSENSIIYDDFSFFGIFKDNYYIDSTISASEIEFTYTGEGAGKLEEYYLLDITENITDFEMTIDLSYEYNGSMLSFGIVHLGSYYLESGLFYGTPEPDDYNFLSWIAARDNWTDKGGVYQVCAYPNDIAETHQGSHGSIGTSGEVTFMFRRTGETLFLGVYLGDTILLAKDWATGVSRFVNYLMLGLMVEDPSYHDYTRVSISSLQGEFTVYSTATTSSTSPQTSNGAPVTILAVVLSVAISTILIALQRKRRPF